jgi:DNA-directed RNA polymerase specialized sigma24 family protein
MKAWLARATASTVRRGDGDTSIARWTRWLPGSGPVEEGFFQGEAEPYPGHWRQSPESWPAGFADERPAREQLRRALAELPAPWRAVVSARDVAGHNAGRVAVSLGLSVEQEQQILNRARAALRVSLCRLARQRA